MPDRAARRRRELKRQRETRQQRARETQAAQAHAAARKDLSRRKRHRIEAISLFALAAIIAIGHLFEHAGSIQLMSQGLEDLFLGYPMAGALALLGVVRLGT